MDSRTAHQALTWATLITGDDDPLVMLVGDLPRPMRFAGDPATAAATSNRFGGTWFGARQDGVPVLAFGLVELGDAAGAIASWCVADPPPSLIDVALDVPHVVAVIPSDVPGVEAFGRDAEASVALLAYATMVEASHPAPSLVTLAESYDCDAPAADPVLVDLVDLDAVRAALAPVRSRVALATGELLTDNQVLPMAWRPWHYNLIEEEHTGGLQWQWPVIQSFFRLAEPTVHSMDGIGSPSPEQRRMLKNYLAIVRRLAGSLAVNSADSIKASWSRAHDGGPVEVDAPHADALAALLPTLRLLFDPQEGSAMSFNHVIKALSAAAHAAGLTELRAELRRWKKAHQRLRRSHLGELRHELAEELSGERLGRVARGPFPGEPEISPEQLIRTYMYGETLHHEEPLEQQIDEWDRSVLLGPVMRLEVRSDAQGFVHFYGAFAGVVARWFGRCRCRQHPGVRRGDAGDPRRFALHGPTRGRVTRWRRQQLAARMLGRGRAPQARGEG